MKQDLDSLGLVIPLYDEEACCVWATRSLCSCLDGAAVPYRLVLVNNGSRDRTGKLVDMLASGHPSVEALHLSRNAGYGGGILQGLRRLETPILGWHWGDGQVEPHVVLQAWRLMRTGSFDMVKARRTMRQDGWARAMVSRSYNVGTHALLGIPHDDLNGCPKLFTRRAMELLTPASMDWLLDLEVMVKAVRHGLEVGQVPAVMRRRSEGASKVNLLTVAEFTKAMGLIALGREPWE